jgi:ribosomal-protein-alanine N-acetyltransferase
MEIRLERCVLRPWRRGDEEALVRGADNRKVWINLRDGFPHPYTRADAKAWIAANAGVEPPRNFAIEVGGRAVGSVGVTQLTDVYRRSAEIGYWLAEEHWGRGIATEATAAATENAFRVLDVVRIQAAVFAWNPASMRVLEKCGYEREGWLRRSVFKDGQVIDSALYARTRG